MIFLGIGKVNMRGKRIANFINGEATVNNPAAINRLRQLGFREKVSVNEIKSKKGHKEKKR